MDQITETARKIDPLAWHRAALAEPDRRKRPPVDVNHPEEGWYRYRRNPRHLWHALKIKWENGEVYACVDKDCWLDLEQILETWTWACDNPVSEAAYDHFLKTGKWLDLDEAVQEQMGRRGLGDNRPPQDEWEQFKIDIENIVNQSALYKEVTEETLEAAQSARARANELARNVDKRREELVAPALREQKEVNNKWMPLVKAAKIAADAIGKAMGAWETKKIRQQREQEAAAQREADRAIAEGTPPSSWEPPPPPSTPAPRTQIKGGYGRAANVQVVRVIEMVTDKKELALAYYTRESVWSEILRLAERDVRNGHTPPGVTITEEGKVK